MQTANSLNKNENLSRGMISGLIAFIIILGLSFTPILGNFERFVGDQLRKNFAAEFVSPIEIIYLDDTSLKDAERDFGVPFPWPRETYADAIHFFKRAGTRAVIFDFLFTSRSNESRADDKVFAKAAKEHGTVVTGMQFDVADQPEARADFAKLPANYDLKVDGIEGLQLANAKGIDAPHLPLWGSFAGIGDTHFEQDKDGLGRRARLLVSMDGKSYPSLAYSAAWLLSGKGAVKAAGGQLSIGGKNPVWIDEQGRMSLLFRSLPKHDKSVRLLDIISSEKAIEDKQAPAVDPARYKGKIIFIGSSAPGLKDLRPSPMSESMPGVELQAMTLDNLLSGESLRVIPMSPLLWGLLLLLCLATARFSWSFKGAVLLLPLILIASLGFMTLHGYLQHHLLLPAATALSGILLALISSSGENYLLERRQRSRVQSIFGQFLSPAVLKTLGTSVGELKTGGETKNLAVFFSDLAGFTSFSEKLTPDQLVVILNEYLEEMAEVVVGKHDGYVDKYIGDAIMAFWGAPTPHSNPALEAAVCAWDCQVKLAEIQDKLGKLGLDAGDEGLVMRIGINYGPCVVGLMGSSRKLNYTVMGDTVNTASRLEGANKPYGTRIMLSDSAREACGDAVITRVLDYLKVKGKTEPTKVHHLIGLKGQGGVLYEPAYVELYHRALEQYREGDFGKAKTIFEECLKAKPKDGVSSLYRDRCVHFMEEPPEGIWDGVYTMKTK